MWDCDARKENRCLRTCVWQHKKAEAVKESEVQGEKLGKCKMVSGKLERLKFGIRSASVIAA
jgi:hypothetical protein